jgi:magnesium-protoporphyrin O-methyltransferase
LKKGQIVFLDNVSTHKVDGVEEAIEARGARACKKLRVGFDAPTLIALARERAPKDLREGSIDFRVGDMLAPSLGAFDYIVAMDSLIHYHAQDMVRALSQLAGRARHGVLLFTFAPRTPALALMHAVGRLFPRSDRAPAIVPVAEHSVRLLLSDAPKVREWRQGRTQRVARGFYTSQAMELAAA